MSDATSRHNSSSNRARQRQMVRQRRKDGAAPLVSGVRDLREQAVRVALPRLDGAWRQNLTRFFSDLFWVVLHSPRLLAGIGAALVLAFLVYIGSYLLGGRLFPNIWALGVPIGDLTLPQAAAALDAHWATAVQIALHDGDRQWVVTPQELGLQLDAVRTAEGARGVGLSGVPFGYGVPPVVSVDYNRAQNYFLDLTRVTDIAPVSAGYAWQTGQVVGIPGTDGRLLDVARLMEQLMADPVAVAETQRLELLMDVIPPEVADPEPLLEAAQRVLYNPFIINGYDPFRDEVLAWSTSNEVLASWLEAGADGLTLRDTTFTVFLDAQNQTLNALPVGIERYLDPKEARASVEAAFLNQVNTVDLRIRYRGTEYVVERGDTARRISRRTGVPFYLIAEANPGRDLDILYPGDRLSIPSRDNALPLPPVASKRIVVDLDRQTLAAFENGQLRFNWLVSSGIDSAPTSPGVYQVLNKDEVAAGSSFTLCSDDGLNCGQWEMNWFMGMYEVVPGLMNGFHGNVLLPNGTLLGGGAVGSPYTFGCIMSVDNNAKALYDWADVGTVVEVISSEYGPQSTLGQLVRSGQIG